MGKGQGWYKYCIIVKRLLISFILYALGGAIPD